MAARLGIRATPTVLVNGWRYSSPPSVPELSILISDLLADFTKPPVP